MASLSALRAGLATRLATISGLNAHADVPDSVTPPAATVRPAPETFIQWDTSMSRGSDDCTFVVTLFVSRASDTAGQSALDEYLAGSGAKSIKTAIEGDATLAGIAHWLQVTEARNYGPFAYGGENFFGCEFVVVVGV
jgi:hypothetical protein